MYFFIHLLSLACVCGSPAFFWTFLPAYLCQYFCLGFVYPSSFSIGLHAFFLQLQPIVFNMCETYQFYSTFIWLYYGFVPIIQTLYYIAFFSFICPDSIFVFLIIFDSVCLLWSCWRGVLFSNRQVFTQILVRQVRIFWHCNFEDISSHSCYWLLFHPKCYWLLFHP